jgi:predicted Fe-Mo cluster-binding NifX family protein
MKLAVTSQGPDLDSRIYVRFDMAKYFVVIDTNSGEFTAHDNSENRGGSQDAAHQAAKMVMNMSVDAVVTCTIDSQAIAVLQGGDVDVYVCAIGSVRDAVEQFRTGRLRSAAKPNVGAHLA